MLILIHKFIEGLSIWYCFKCKHKIHIHKNKKVKCLYCGNEETGIKI
jgi:exosome complex RNA-binding protein Csl4